MGAFSHHPRANALRVKVLEPGRKRAVAFARGVGFEVINAFDENLVDITGFYEFVNIDGSTRFRLGLFEVLGIQDYIFSFIDLISFNLFFGRHGSFFEFAHHALLKFYPVGLMQEVKLDAVLTDGGVEFYRHGYSAELYVSDPKR
jgi:hypothetical protein